MLSLQYEINNSCVCQALFLGSRRKNTRSQKTSRVYYRSDFRIRQTRCGSLGVVSFFQKRLAESPEIARSVKKKQKFLAAASVQQEMKFSLGNIRPDVRALVQELSTRGFIKKFYLAGGTAVALFLHHRRSDDLDFFSEKNFRGTTLIGDLKKVGKFENLKSEKDTLLGKLSGIKVSFFSLPYKLLEPPVKNKNLRVAMPLDLALMKILAVSDRGTKRDFIDLYLLCKNVKPLEELLLLFQKKFGKYDFNIQHIIKSLSYFDDADKGEMPEMYIDIEWEGVKSFFSNQKLTLAKKFFGI